MSTMPIPQDLQDPAQAAAEEDAALAAGFVPASLGTRVLRAETASVAALAMLGLE